MKQLSFILLTVVFFLGCSSDSNKDDKNLPELGSVTMTLDGSSWESQFASGGVYQVQDTSMAIISATTASESSEDSEFLALYAVNIGNNDFEREYNVFDIENEDNIDEQTGAFAIYMDTTNIYFSTAGSLNLINANSDDNVQGTFEITFTGEDSTPSKARIRQFASKSSPEIRERIMSRLETNTNGKNTRHSFNIQATLQGTDGGFNVMYMELSEDNIDI